MKLYGVANGLGLLHVTSGCGSTAVFELMRRGEGLFISELDSVIKHAVQHDGIDTASACIIASKSRAAGMNPVNVVKEALYEECNFVLLCVQSKIFLGWEHSKDYHWFYAISFGKCWFKEELWDGMEFDWAGNFIEILRADNVEFFEYAKNMNLVPSVLHGKTVLTVDLLKSLEAVNIMQHLRMAIISGEAKIDKLKARGRTKTLRLLHDNGIDIFKDSELFSWIGEPDLLAFVLSVRPEIVNTARIVKFATVSCNAGLLKVLYRHQRIFPLNSEHLTTAANHGCLEILEWAQAIDKTLRPNRDCMENIMVSGHTGVFDFLRSLGLEFLPDQYQASTANSATMWHYDMIVVIYYLKPELAPLELLYRHAMDLCIHRAVAWISDKIYETTCKIMKLAVNDLDHAIDSGAWLLVEWIVRKNPSLLPSRKRITVAMKADCSRTRRKMVDFLMLLKSLYAVANGDFQYLPTCEELCDQPVNCVQWVYSQNPEHLLPKDLVTLCKVQGGTAQLHKWAFRKLGIDVATSEMANAAVKIGNIKALSWIVDKNPEAFPSRESIQIGLEKECKNIELLIYTYIKRPEHVPDVEMLVKNGYHRMAPGIVQNVRDFQRKQKNHLADTLWSEMLERVEALSIESY